MDLTVFYSQLYYKLNISKHFEISNSVSKQETQKGKTIIITYIITEGKNPVLSEYTKIWIVKPSSVTIIHGRTKKITHEGLHPVLPL